MKNIERSKSWLVWLRWGVTLVSLSLLIWLVSRQDWRGLIQAGRQVGLAGVVAGLALVIMRQVLNAARWFSLLRVLPGSIQFLESVKLTFAGLFASNFLPTTIGGDVVRLGGILNLSEDKVAGSASLVVDRLIGAVSMLVFLPFGLPLMAGILENRGGPQLAAGLLGGGLRFRASQVGRRLIRALEPWRSKPSALIIALGINWLAAGVYFLAVWIIASGIGISVGYWQVAGATALTYYLTLLPISINGYGLRELGVVAVYGQLGASIEAATALALITRGLLWATSLPGGLLIGPALASRRQESIDA